MCRFSSGPKLSTQSFEWIPTSTITGLYSWSTFNFGRNCRLSSEWLARIPTAMQEGSCGSVSWPAFAVVSVLHCGRSNRHVAVSVSLSFWFALPWEYVVWSFFHMLICHVCIFLMRRLLGSSAHFSNQVLCLLIDEFWDLSVYFGRRAPDQMYFVKMFSSLWLVFSSSRYWLLHSRHFEL